MATTSLGANGQAVTPMRIGLNALYLIPGKVGGTEVYARNLLAALARGAASNDELVVYVAREAAGTLGPLPPNVREVACDVAAERRPARLAYEQAWLPRLARRDRLDVLHSLGYTAPLALGCPGVVTLHDLNYHFHPEDWSRAALWANRLLVPAVARRATRVLTISNSSRDAIRDVLGIPVDRIDVVYHGIDGNVAEADDAAVAAVRARLELPAAYLLTVTATHPHKNLAGLLAAYTRLCAARDRPPPPLVIVGIRGRDHAAIERAAREAPTGRIVVTGWIESAELGALYRGARAFVFPSKYEGFGFPALEAMSVGTPVASSTAASLAELVDEAAETFDPDDIAGMAAAIERTLDDDKRRRELIERGDRRAGEFTWARCAQETFAVYRRAVSG